MGLTHSRDTDTINWNNIKTNDMSSTIPNLNGISFEAKQLLSKLNLPEISETNSEFNSNLIFNKNDDEISKELSEKDNAVSSPFISSEMYNYLVNKYNKNGNMVGGATKDDDDTSETSSSSDIENEDEDENEDEPEPEPEPESELKPKKVKKEKKEKKVKNNKEVKSQNKVEQVDETEENNSSNNDNYEGKKNKKSKMYKGSETYLSYLSSSAHTGGSISETIPNENNYSISSVNTSDLNMISDN